MLDDLKKAASDLYPEDPQSQNAFMQGFYKEAADGGFFNSPLGSKGEDSIRSTLIKGLSQAVGKGVGDLAIAAGATGIGTAYGAIRDTNLHNKFLQALERAYQMNSILRQTDKKRVLQYGETIFKFAPNVATDPNLLSSTLANAIHGEGIDVMTIKTLTELENRYKDNSSFSPKTYV